jgi:hypothetical protein
LQTANTYFFSPHVFYFIATFKFVNLVSTTFYSIFLDSISPNLCLYFVSLVDKLVTSSLSSSSGTLHIRFHYSWILGSLLSLSSMFFLGNVINIQYISYHQKSNLLVFNFSKEFPFET